MHFLIPVFKPKRASEKSSPIPKKITLSVRLLINILRPSLEHGLRKKFLKFEWHIALNKSCILLSDSKLPLSTQRHFLACHAYVVITFWNASAVRRILQIPFRLIISPHKFWYVMNWRHRAPSAPEMIFVSNTPYQLKFLVW